jgi:hypothetical protein
MDTGVSNRVLRSEPDPGRAPGDGRDRCEETGVKTFFQKFLNLLRGVRPLETPSLRQRKPSHGVGFYVQSKALGHRGSDRNRTVESWQHAATTSPTTATAPARPTQQGGPARQPELGPARSTSRSAARAVPAPRRASSGTRQMKRAESAMLPALSGRPRST